MAIGNLLPEWWWAFILLFTCEVSLVYIFDRLYNLKIGNPTYVALAGLAFVFAPAFFSEDSEQKTTAEGQSYTTIAAAKYKMEKRKEAKEARERAAELKAKKERLAGKLD